jgi:hypothetical protein
MGNEMPRRAVDPIDFRDIHCKVTAEAFALLQAECESLRDVSTTYVPYGAVINDLILRYLARHRNGAAAAVRRKTR